MYYPKPNTQTQTQTPLPISPKSEGKQVEMSIGISHRFDSAVAWIVGGRFRRETAGERR